MVLRLAMSMILAVLSRMLATTSVPEPAEEREKAATTFSREASCIWPPLDRRDWKGIRRSPGSDARRGRMVAASPGGRRLRPIAAGCLWEPGWAGWGAHDPRRSISPPGP